MKTDSETNEQRLCRFVASNLIPFLTAHGYDEKRQQFHEALDGEGRPLSLGYERLVVQCRQIFSFAEASLLGNGVDYASKDIANAAFQKTCNRFWRGPDAGWVFAVGESSSLPPETRDLYAHAFVLLACSASIRANDVSDADLARTIARSTHQFIIERFSNPNGGFYTALDREFRPINPGLQQNPHMHLFEAYSMLAETTGEFRYVDAANEIIDLFRSKFLVGDTVREFFDDRWAPDPEQGETVAPGHHFEWAWLIQRFSADTNPLINAQVTSDRLLAWAVTNGIRSENGSIHLAVGADGSIQDPAFRIWTIMEALKGISFASTDSFQPELSRLWSLLWSHFLNEKIGTWNEYLNSDLVLASNSMPGSTAYHIVMAARELNWLARRE